MTGSRSPTERDPMLKEVAALLDSSLALAPGTLLGDRFEVIEWIGMGGMGVVYRARDAKLGRDIAVKLQRDDTPGGEARLLGEARAMAKLSHPNVVPAYELGTHEGAVFIAMELVEGTTLRDWLRGGRRGWREVVEMFRAAAAGLMAIHRAGLIYRDFKPENVLVGADGRVRVADLGLARPMGVAGEGPLSGMSGTPTYMAPELWEQHPPDTRSDQYAFCVALYEALFGGLPDPAREPRGDVPGPIRAAVMRGLARDPAARHPSMEALVRALSWDPGLRRRRVAAAVVVGGLAGAAIWGALREPAAVGPCAAGDAKLREGWNAASRAEARAAFVASGRPYGADTWSRVDSSLDAYGASYVAARRQACEAPSSVTELQVACLDLRVTGMVELVRVLQRADAALVDRAVSAVGALEPLDRCADTKALLGATPLPTDPALRSRVEGALGRLETVAAFRRAGRNREGIFAGHAVIAEARALAYEPLLAKALVETAVHTFRNRDAKGAETLLREALAARNADDETVALAAAMLIWVTGAELQRHDEAMGMVPTAEVMAARAGGRAPALLANAVGNLAFMRGRYEEALSAYRRSLRFLEARSDSRSTQAAVWQNITAALKDLKRLDEAEAANARALELGEQELGPGHPEVAKMYLIRGDLAYERRHLDEAQAAYERARDIFAGAFGPEHVMAALALHQLADLEIDRGRAQEALVVLERVLAVRERALGPENAETLGTVDSIAVALYRLGRLEEAQVTAARSLAGYESLGREHPRLHVPLMTLARIAERRKQPAVVRDLAGRALAIARAKIGEKSSDTVEPLILVGAAARLEGKRDEALAVLEQALEIATTADGDGHVRTARARVALAETLIHFGRVPDAIAHLERALPVLDGDSGAANNGFARLLLSRAHQRNGDAGRARELAREAEAECRSGCDANTRADIAAWLRAHDRR